MFPPQKYDAGLEPRLKTWELLQVFRQAPVFRIVRHLNMRDEMKYAQLCILDTSIITTRKLA